MPAALQWGFNGVKQGQNLPWACFKCFISRAAGWVPVHLCSDTSALRVEGKPWVGAPSVLCLGFSGQPSPCPWFCISFCAAVMLPPTLLVVENIQWQRDHEAFGRFACGKALLLHNRSDLRLNHICLVWFSWPFLVSWSFLKFRFFFPPF